MTPAKQAFFICLLGTALSLTTSWLLFPSLLKQLAVICAVGTAYFTAAGWWVGRADRGSL